MSTIEIVLVTEEHGEALVRFFRDVWDAEADVSEVQKSIRTSPSISWAETSGTPAFAYLSDGNVLGYVSTLPMGLWCDGRLRTGHWMKGLMVRKEYRGGPVGFMVLKHAVEHLDLAGSICVAPAARRLFSAMGFREHGTLSNYFLPLQPTNILRSLDVDALGLAGLPVWVTRATGIVQQLHAESLAGFILRVGIGARKVVSRKPTKKIEVTYPVTRLLRKEVDSLWAEARQAFQATTVRDFEYFNWRYRQQGAGKYDFLTIRRDGRFAGIGVVRRPKESGDSRLKGLKIGVLSDLLYHPGDPFVGAAILRAAEKLALRQNCDGLLCSASHAEFLDLLPKHGYLKFPGTLYFLLKDPEDSTIQKIDIRKWWLTRGDGAADEVF